MKRLWSAEELVEGWTVSESDLQRRPDKLPSGRLGFVAQLAFFRVYARFPEQRSEFAAAVLTHLAEQVGVSASVVDEYEWAGRTGRRHRATIREMLGILTRRALRRTSHGDPGSSACAAFDGEGSRSELPFRGQAASPQGGSARKGAPRGHEPQGDNARGWQRKEVLEIFAKSVARSATGGALRERLCAQNHWTPACRIVAPFEGDASHASS